MYSNYRKDEMERKLDVTLDVMVTGVTGAGKSTTLNSIFAHEIAEIGMGVDPQTMELDSYLLHDRFRFWDTPGLGDGIQKDKEHSKKLLDLLYLDYHIDSKQYGFIDMVVVIIEGSKRDMGTVYRLLNDIIVPNFPKKRILVAINQADIAMKGRYWDFNTKSPLAILQTFLEEQAISLQKRVLEATGVKILKPIYYSAEQNYNIQTFLDFIIDNMPTEKRDIQQLI